MYSTCKFSSFHECEIFSSFFVLSFLFTNFRNSCVCSYHIMHYVLLDTVLFRILMVFATHIWASLAVNFAALCFHLSFILVLHALVIRDAVWSCVAILCSIWSVQCSSALLCFQPFLNNVIQANSTHNMWATRCLLHSVMLSVETFEIRKCLLALFISKPK